MTPICVKQIVRWLQQSDRVTYDNESITLYSLFKIAMHDSFEHWNENLIQSDMARFERDGYMPAYLVVFMRKKMYPFFLLENTSLVVVQPKLLT